MQGQDLGPTDSGAPERLSRTEPGACRWSVASPWAMAALVALKLWLVAGQQHAAIATAGYDDALYIKLARHLARHLVTGEWLGPYDHLTLLKGPGYSLWVAGNFFIGLPLHVSQHLVYAGACALFVVAIRPRVSSRLVRLGLFAVLLFQPMSFSTSTLRYTRDSLYTTQVLGALSCLLGMMVRLDAPLRVIVRWSLGFGFIGGFLWVTRDEGVVILPAVGAAWAMIAVRLWRDRRPDWLRRALAIALSLPLAVALVLAVAQMNRRHYGIFTISELKKAEHTDAVGALARVEPAQLRRWVIVSTETRERIYPYSSSFRELQPILEGPRRKLWGSMGPLMFEWDQAAMRDEILTGKMLGTICHETVEWDQAAMQEEIMTGWFFFALREAVVLTGRYNSAPEAMRYYARLADEVNAACAAGLLRCGPSRSSLAPPWRREYLGLTLRRMCRGAARLVTLADMPTFPTIGSEELLAPFRNMTNDRLTPVSGAAPPPRSERTVLDQWKLERLMTIHRVYAATLPTVGVLAVASFVLCLSLGRARRTCRLLGPALVLLMAIGARLALLAYMDATAFPRALIPLYMLPIYPLMLGFFLLALIDGLHVLASVGWRGAHR